MNRSSLDEEEMTLGELAEIIQAVDSGEQTITIPADTEPEEAAVEFSLTVGEVQGRVDGTATFLLQIYDVVNALFEDVDEKGETTTSTRWEQTFTVKSSEDFYFYSQVKETIPDLDSDYAFVCQNFNTGEWHGWYPDNSAATLFEKVTTDDFSLQGIGGGASSSVSYSSSIIADGGSSSYVYINYKQIPIDITLEAEGENIVGTMNVDSLDLYPYPTSELDDWGHVDYFTGQSRSYTTSSNDFKRYGGYMCKILSDKNSKSSADYPDIVFEADEITESGETKEIESFTDTTDQSYWNPGEAVGGSSGYWVSIPDKIITSQLNYHA